MKAQLNRIALRAADADKAVADLNALLGVTFYGPYNDEHMGLRVALPKSGGIEVMAPMHDHRCHRCIPEAPDRGRGHQRHRGSRRRLRRGQGAFAAKGLKPAVEFNHGKFREMIFLPSLRPTASRLRE